MNRRRLTAKEFTALGIAWARGPCTTYALMKALPSLSSPDEHTSAGTAYPLVNRLIRALLLEPIRESGPDGRRLIHVTLKGLDVLNSWVEKPLHLADVPHSMDRIPLCAFRLGVSSSKERRKLIDHAIATLLNHLADCEHAIVDHRQTGSSSRAHELSEYVRETKVRLKWLSSVRGAGASSLSHGPS